MGGGCPSLINICCILRRCPSGYLDLVVWSASPTNIRQRCAVHFSIVGPALQQAGIKQLLTTAYHPQSNGMIERWHRQLKDALWARLAGSDWPEHLPWVLLSLRTTPKEDAAVSSAELVFGSQLCLPGEWLADSEQPASSFLQELCRRLPVAIPTRPLSYAEAVMSPPAHLADVEMVMIRKGPISPPLAPQYDGPFKVASRGPKVFHLDFGGRIEVVLVDRLKSFLGESTKPAIPPKRGRLLGLPAASTPIFYTVPRGNFNHFLEIESKLKILIIKILK